MSKKNPVIYRVLRFILTPIFKFYYNPKIINKEVIPKNGAILLCGNHLHFMDQFPVIASTKRTIHWMSKKEYFEGKHRLFFKLVGCISVDRSAHNGVAKAEAIRYLKMGSAVGLFPEGTRNRTEAELLPFKKGAAKMAREINCPIVPFAVTGEYKFRSKNLMVRFGNPIDVGEKTVEEVTEELKSEILSLQRENYKATEKSKNT